MPLPCKIEKSRQETRRDADCQKNLPSRKFRREEKCERKPSGCPFASNNPPQRQNYKIMLQNLILQFGKQLGKKARRDFFDKLTRRKRSGSRVQKALRFVIPKKRSGVGIPSRKFRTRSRDSPAVTSVRQCGRSRYGAPASRPSGRIPDSRSSGCRLFGRCAACRVSS